MSIALVAHVSGNGSAFTTASIDTTGANFLIASQSGFSGLGTVSDSKSNTWTALTSHGSSSFQRLYYAKNAIVGSGHTFTVTGGSSGSLEVAAFSGLDTTSPFDVEAGTLATSGAAQAGSVTPAAANSLVIAGVAYQNNGVSLSGIDLSFTITDTEPGAGVIRGSLAYLIETSIAAKNPTWTFSGSNAWAATNAVFKAGASPGDVTAVAATAAAAAVPPVVTGAGTVLAVPMTAAAAAIPPVATGAANVTAVAATAAAAMLPPVIGIAPNVLAVSMTATAAAIPPVVTGAATIQAIAANALAAMGTPVVHVVLPPAAAGIFRPGVGTGNPVVFRGSTVSGTPSPFRQDPGPPVTPGVFKPN